MLKRVILIFVSYLCLAASSVLSDTGPPVRYRIIQLSLPKGKITGVFAINDKGQILGTAVDSSGLNHVVIWQGSKLWTIGNLPGYSEMQPGGINNDGIVVGTASISKPNYKSQAFEWHDGKLRPLYGLGGSTAAFGINNKGQVVGVAETVSSHTHAAMWKNDRVTDLDPTTVLPSIANVITDGGLIAGGVSSPRGIQDLAIYSNGRMRDLNVMSGYRTIVTSANDLNQIVGQAEIPFRTETQTGFVASVRNGKLINFHTLLHGTGTGIFSINDKGQFVGTINNHAFIESHGKIEYLNSLITNRSGWVIWQATRINNREQIVGTGSFKGQRSHFLLVPIASTLKTSQ